MKNHRDFNETGPWAGSKSDKAVRATFSAAQGVQCHDQATFLNKFKNDDNYYDGITTIATTYFPKGQF